jgi:tetratricopeptide (TPR) repeat protein
MPVCEDVVTAFEVAWNAGGRPRVVDFAPPDDPDTLRALVEVDLERRIKAGQAARAGDYLRLGPVRDDRAFVLALMHTEFRLRRAGREPELTAAEFLAQYPEWVEGLAAGLPADPAPQSPAPSGAAGGFPPIDGFEVVREIGQGGMGRVYLARHAATGRLVAVKVLTAGPLAAPDQRKRFDAEVQALSRLEHPNLIRMYDRGETRAGAPYYVMEYAAGGTLDRKTENQPQPPGEAAAATAALARAVHHAHEGGVLHRDLKPTNVLLDRGGALKVSDFGLAKLLDAADLTATGAVVGTPAFMSPEQASGSGDTDRRTDVYGLGAVLYWLLTGRPPFEGETAALTLERVRSGDLVPPGRLRDYLPRDLETVCLKCLSRDPGGRYATAQELADDLDRFLRGEPVRARRPGPLARTARWTRRNPAWATAAAVTVLAAAGLVALAARLEFSRRELRMANTDLQNANADLLAARQLEAQQRAVAAERLGQARGGISLLRDLFRDLNPSSGRVKPLHEALADRLGTRVLEIPDGGDELLAAELRESLGEAYHGLAYPDKAVNQFEACAAIRARLLGPDHADTLRARHHLGEALRVAGDTDRAARELTDVLARRRATLGADHPETAATQLAVANVESDRGNFHALLEQIGPTAQAVGKQPDMTAAARRLDELMKAAAGGELRVDDPGIEATVNEIIAALKRLRPPGDPILAEAELGLATVYVSSGKLDRALSLYETAYPRLVERLSPKHPKVVAVRQGYGAALIAAGQFGRGLAMLDVNLESTNDRQSLTFLASLTIQLEQVGHTAVAAALYPALLARMQKALGPADALTLGFTAAAGRASRTPGRAAAIIPTLEAAVRAAEQAGTGSLVLAYVRGNLASCLAVEGRARDAVPLYRQASEAIDAAQGASGLDALIVAAAWARALLLDGQSAAAGTRADAFCRAWELATPAVRLAATDALNDAAEPLIATGRTATARKLLEAHVAALAAEYGPKTPVLFAVRQWLGVALLAEKKHAAAAEQLAAGLEVVVPAGRIAWDFYLHRSLLGEALLGAGKSDEAEPHLLEGYRGLSLSAGVIIVSRRAEYLTQAAERLVRLYTAKGMPEKAAEWEKTRAKHAAAIR